MESNHYNSVSASNDGPTPSGIVMIESFAGSMKRRAATNSTKNEDAVTKQPQHLHNNRTLRLVDDDVIVRRSNVDDWRNKSRRLSVLVIVFALACFLLIFVRFVPNRNNNYFNTISNKGRLGRSFQNSDYDFHDHIRSDDKTTIQQWDYRSRMVSSFDPTIPVLADEGIYRFMDAPYCGDDSGECYIHFPSTTCSVDSCVVTLKGSKDQQERITFDDTDDEEKQQKQPQKSMLPNQDRIMLITPSSRRIPVADPKEVRSSSKREKKQQQWFMASLFDGHGDYGHYSSQAASMYLPIRLLQEYQKKSVESDEETIQRSNKNNITEMLTESCYLQTDQHDSIRTIPNSGTTAITIWQEGTVLHIASSGDSVAYIIQWNTNTSNNNNYRIIAEARKHKPADPMERARIEGNGGQVYIPPNGHSSRVLFTMPMLDENQQDTGMYVQMGIAMSRSIGDQEAKDRNLLIPNPTIVSVDLLSTTSTSSTTSSTAGTLDGPNDSHNNNGDDDASDGFFIIMATDGLLDVLDPVVVITTIGNALYYNDDPKETATAKANRLHAACQELLENAKKRWAIETQNLYRDDISLLVKRIEL